MRIVWFDSLDSTNSEALRRLPELETPVVLAAREQTAGRGQRGNSWFSAPGQNLTFSIVLRFRPDELPAADAVWLNYISALVVADYVESLGVGCSVKWPNDIYAGRDKICGMLIENSLEGNCVAASVIGIGLNMNQLEFPQLARASSVSRCTGCHYDLEESLEALAERFEDALPALFDSLRRSSLFDRYTARLFQKDVRARYRDLLTGREFDGLIRGVAPDGRLLLEDAATGSLLRYRFKEVGYIL